MLLCAETPLSDLLYSYNIKINIYIYMYICICMYMYMYVHAYVEICKSVHLNRDNICSQYFPSIK